jgi:hypothetical protein
MPFSAQARTTLTGLAEGLLPLQDWVTSESHRYVPPNATDLPWRAGEILTHERLQTIAYVEWLVAASDADDLLLARWDHIRQDPLAYCPLPSPRAFREGRGLSQAPRFATVESGNALADASGRQMSRRFLYDQCTPILIETVKEAQKRLGKATPPPSPFWSTLAQELHRGNCPEWRGIAGAPQSTLLTEQLLRDVLTALLNGWLDVPPPWRYAVLIELGEFRRPGNAYARSDVESALQSFKDALGHRPESPKTPELDIHPEDVRHVTEWKSIP